MEVVRPARVFYVGAFLFPDRDAGALRVLGIGKALRDAGYEVVFLGAESTGRPEDAVRGGEYEYDEFRYCPAGNPGSSPIVRARRLWRTHLSGLSAISRLAALWDDSTVAVIAYQASSALLARLVRFCDRRGAALVGDVVEWYDRQHVRWGRLGPFAVDSEVRMRIMHGRTDGVVAISSYLERYYRAKGLPTLRIPALIDAQRACWNPERVGSKGKRPLQLAFVGGAGRKDLLVNAVRGLASLGCRAGGCEVTIVGPSKDEVRESLGRDADLLKEMGARLRFTGRVSHEEALRHLAHAEFSILLRPGLRFAHAGFPTKLVESLAMGVPAICNLTGDVGMYVRDGVEGLVVADSSPGSFASGLVRAMGMSGAQREAMSRHARQMAERSFDYRKWVTPLGEFMKRLTKGRKDRREGKGGRSEASSAVPEK